MIIGLNGLIGSGKCEVSKYLQTKYNFKHISFADSLKSSVASVFGWPYEMLLGHTEESRKWRESIDSWWAKRLNIPNLTPRWVLQYWGTDLCRCHFHQDIWVASLERKLIENQNNIVIDDCRFINEMNAIQNQNGILIRINRGALPEWYADALSELRSPRMIMEILHPDIHISEWGWCGQKFNYEIDNNGTIDELHAKIDLLISPLL